MWCSEVIALNCRVLRFSRLTGVGVVCFWRGHGTGVVNYFDCFRCDDVQCKYDKVYLVPVICVGKKPLKQIFSGTQFSSCETIDEKKRS